MAPWAIGPIDRTITVVRTTRTIPSVVQRATGGAGTRHQRDTSQYRSQPVHFFESPVRRMRGAMRVPAVSVLGFEAHSEFWLAGLSRPSMNWGMSRPARKNSMDVAAWFMEVWWRTASRSLGASTPKPQSRAKYVRPLLKIR